MTDWYRWLNLFHGLELYPDHDSNGRGNENGILFLVYLFLILKKRNELQQHHIDLFNDIVARITVKDRIKTYHGLYDRGQNESYEAMVTDSSDKLRTISHDNISAISCFSSLIQNVYSTDIIFYGLKHIMVYNNRYPGTILPVINLQVHPRDLFMWFYNAKGLNRYLSYVFAPFFVISQIMTCLTDYNETSGKLLMWMRTECMPDESPVKKLMKLTCYNILKKRYGKNWLHVITSIYFYQENHPIPNLSRDLEF